MTEFIRNFFGNDYISAAVMSFIPMIELKGGIVFGVSAGMNVFLAFALAYLGSTLVFFPIYWLLRPILELLKKIKWFSGVAVKVENYFKKKADDTLKKQQDKSRKRSISDTLIKQLGVFIFVAVPLPLTGVWTGTAIAVFLNLKFKDAVLPVVLGNFVAGILIMLLSMLCGVIGINLDYVLYALFALAAVLLIVTIIKVAVGKPNENEKEPEDITEENK